MKTVFLEKIHGDVIKLTKKKILRGLTSYESVVFTKQANQFGSCLVKLLTGKHFENLVHCFWILIVMLKKFKSYRIGINWIFKLGYDL